MEIIFVTQQIDSHKIAATERPGSTKSKDEI